MHTLSAPPRNVYCIQWLLCMLDHLIMDCLYPHVSMSGQIHDIQHATGLTCACSSNRTSEDDGGCAFPLPLLSTAPLLGGRIARNNPPRNRRNYCENQSYVAMSKYNLTCPLVGSINQPSVRYSPRISCWRVCDQI